MCCVKSCHECFIHYFPSFLQHPFLPFHTSFPCFILHFLSTLPLHASSFPSFPHFLSMLHPFLPFHTFLSRPHPTILSSLSFPGEASSSEIIVVVCFGMISDLADLRTKADQVTAASSGLIHVTGGLCLSSSSFEIHPSDVDDYYNIRYCINSSGFVKRLLLSIYINLMNILALFLRNN